MHSGLIVPVADIIGVAGKERSFSGELPTSLRLGETFVEGPIEVRGVVSGLTDAVRAEFEASAPAHMTCTRCLKEWDETVFARSEQFFAIEADEDGYGIVGGSVDLSGPAGDELALALPPTPLCRDDCRGLCPTCGTDLNSDPCDGHGDDADSPFAVLKDLFDS